jgi:hypothetical protein
MQPANQHPIPTSPRHAPKARQRLDRHARSVPARSQRLPRAVWEFCLLQLHPGPDTRVVVRAGAARLGALRTRARPAELERPSNMCVLGRGERRVDLTSRSRNQPLDAPRADQLNHPHSWEGSGGTRLHGSVPACAARELGRAWGGTSAFAAFAKRLTAGRRGSIVLVTTSSLAVL